MKDRLLIVFQSKHGYVKRYVDIIGNAVGCDAVPADKLRGEMLGCYDKILFMGSLRSGVISGLKKIAPYYDVIYKKLIVCGIGVTPFRDYMPARVKETSVSTTYEKFVPVFYAQGGFDIKELSRIEKWAIGFRIKQLQASPVPNDDDAYFVEAAKTPVDEVKKENIMPLIDYLEGRPVDAKLYSPPEITDPEEEKRFFEEIAEATGDKKSKTTKAAKD